MKNIESDSDFLESCSCKRSNNAHPLRVIQTGGIAGAAWSRCHRDLRWCSLIGRIGRFEQVPVSDDH